ncbi:hypothetical protein HYPSUDRAFT_204256 [Hypholoma sublateritium FD-334 SS-4]|uniref:SMODS and SLOG-associating 2TM effector domain-containing protein n=1 Tax=Hypholoma sublateritium (strain FD-334 SS-4) TaxID=945553 RepID=A0A0D2KZC4_HYPSF|nr:hypothetical protein HYPSUDRAFT_204256 [Hypholoma sublateritium FD-334 SS-4]
MASERATPSASQQDQPSSVHEATPGARGDASITSSARQSSGGDPFAVNPGRRIPPQDPNVAIIGEQTLANDPQLIGVEERRGGMDNNFPRQDMQQSRPEGYQTYNRSLPPSPRGVRLADTQFTAQPVRQRALSVDPNNRSSIAPSGRLSQHLSRLGVHNDRGEIFYNEKHLPVIHGSIQDRLSKTIESAESERNKYAARARATGLALNVAIGLQVLLGSLTTGLSAVATRGKSSAVATTILGALATLVASYLARARGSNEPELSITRTKDLEHFLRECNNFSDDHANYIGHDLDNQLDNFRRRFEELLGNANGERKLSPPGS